MNEKLIKLEDIKQAFKEAGIAASLEYPYYLQIGEIAFGHSLMGEDNYTWNNESGSKCGQIGNFANASEVVAEFIKQTREKIKC